MAFHAKLHRAEIAPIEEILGVALEQESSFDERSDKQMDERAEKLLAERRAMRNV